MNRTAALGLFFLGLALLSGEADILAEYRAASPLTLVVAVLASCVFAVGLISRRTQ